MLSLETHFDGLSPLSKVPVVFRYKNMYKTIFACLKKIPFAFVYFMYILKTKCITHHAIHYCWNKKPNNKTTQNANIVCSLDMDTTLFWFAPITPSSVLCMCVCVCLPHVCTCLLVCLHFRNMRIMMHVKSVMLALHEGATGATAQSALCDNALSLYIYISISRLAVSFRRRNQTINAVLIPCNAGSSEQTQKIDKCNARCGVWDLQCAFN